jgi:hexosaminidase
VQYNVFPRLAAIMEKAWSPAEATDDADAVIGRMQVQGVRWMFGRTNFYADPEVVWKPAAVGTVLTMDEDGIVDGTVATAAIPDTAPSEFTATIDWGDGTHTSGTITGTGPSNRQINSLFEVSGAHRYATPGRYTGTVTLTGPQGTELSAPFTVAEPDG